MKSNTSQKSASFLLATTLFFVFLFVASASAFASDSANWTTYGFTPDVSQAQSASSYGFFGSGNITRLTYPDGISSTSQQPLVSGFGSNNKLIVVQDGNYLNFLTKDLVIAAQKAVGATSSQLAINSNQIMGVFSNATGTTFRVYSFDPSTYTLTLTKNLILDSATPLEQSGTNCLDGQFCAFYFKNSTRHIGIYYNTGVLNLYTISENLSSEPLAIGTFDNTGVNRLFGYERSDNAGYIYDLAANKLNTMSVSRGLRFAKMVITLPNTYGMAYVNVSDNCLASVGVLRPDGSQLWGLPMVDAQNGYLNCANYNVPVFTGSNTTIAGLASTSSDSMSASSEIWTAFTNFRETVAPFHGLLELRVYRAQDGFLIASASEDTVSNTNLKSFGEGFNLPRFSQRMTIAKMTPNDKYAFVLTYDLVDTGNGIDGYNLSILYPDNTNFYKGSTSSQQSCVTADLSGDGLTDIVCSGNAASTLIISSVDTTPTNTTITPAATTTLGFVDTIIGIFPPASSLNLGQSMGFVLIVMLVTCVGLLFLSSRLPDGISPVVMYVIGVVLIVEFIFFAVIQYIPLGFVLLTALISVVIIILSLKGRGG